LLTSVDHDAWSPREGILDPRRARTISDGLLETFHFAISPFMTSTKRAPSCRCNSGGPWFTPSACQEGNAGSAVDEVSAWCDNAAMLAAIAHRTGLWTSTASATCCHLIRVPYARKNRDETSGQSAMEKRTRRPRSLRACSTTPHASITWPARVRREHRVDPRHRAGPEGALRVPHLCAVRAAGSSSTRSEQIGVGSFPRGKEICLHAWMRPPSELEGPHPENPAPW